MRLKGISDYIDIINEEYKLHFKLFLNSEYEKCELNIVSNINSFRNIINKIEKILDDGLLVIEYHTTGIFIYEWNKNNKQSYYNIYTSNQQDVVIIKLELYKYKDVKLNE